MPDRRPNWRAGQTAAQAARKTASPKRGKIIAVVFVMLALGGAIAALVFYLQPLPEPYFEAVWIDEYKDARIPANAWSAADRTALRGVRWQEKNTFTLQARHLLVQELTTLRTKVDRPLVVYLCAYAVVGEGGGVFLLPGDAQLDEPASWLPLAEVLRYLRDCPSPQKLLLLDIARPFVDPRAGVLANDVADRLKPVVEAAVKDDPRLLVLCSCSPGQVSWTGEDLGHSVFAYYALLALQGRADGWHGAKDDARISAQELISYVIFHVDRWSRANRKTPQTPLFIGANLDLPLVPAESNASPTAEESEAVYPPKLQAGWKAHDEWWSSRTYQRLPEVFRQMQAALMRAEQRWRGGVEAGKVESDLKLLMDRWEQHRKDSARPITSLAPRSLAEAVARGQKPPALTGAVLQKLRDLADLDARVRGPKQEDKDKAKLTTDREAFLKQFSEGKSFDLAYTIFHVAANETNPRLELVRFWADLLRSIKPPVRYVETEFLFRLEKLAGEGQTWPVKAAHLGLQMVRDAEAALAGDGDTMPWVRPLIDDAQRRRQQDEAELLVDEAGPRDAVAARLRDTGHAFQVILRNMKNVTDGYRLRDEAMIFLPTYPSYLEIHAAEESTWLNAIQNTRALSMALAAPPSRSTKLAPEFFKNVGDLAEALQENLRQLRQPFAATRVKAALDQAKNAGPAGWHELNGLLDSPWLSSGDRVIVWKAVREISAGLQKKTAEVDQADEAAKGKARPTFDGERAVQQEWTRALQRARWSIELLKLEGRPEAPELEKLVQQAVKEPVRGPASQALARELRRAWSQPPPARD